MELNEVTSTLNQCTLILRGIAASQSMNFEQLRDLWIRYRQLPETVELYLAISKSEDTSDNGALKKAVEDLSAVLSSAEFPKIDTRMVLNEYMQRFDGQISEQSTKMVEAHRELINADNRLSMEPEDADCQTEYSRLESKYKEEQAKLQMLHQMADGLQQDAVENSDEIFQHLISYCQQACDIFAPSKQIEAMPKIAHMKPLSECEPDEAPYFDMELIGAIYKEFCKTSPNDIGLFEPISQLDFFRVINLIPSSQPLIIASKGKNRSGVLFLKLRNRLPIKIGNLWFAEICRLTGLNASNISRKRSTVESDYGSRANLEFNESLDEILDRFPAD